MEAFKIKNGLQAGRYLGSNGTVTAGAGTASLDLTTGVTFSFTTSGATTVSFTNPPASGLAIAFTIILTGDGSAVTWPTAVKWHGGSAPTATSTKDAYNFITTDGGTTYLGRRSAENLS